MSKSIVELVEKLLPLDRLCSEADVSSNSKKVKAENHSLMLTKIRRIRKRLKH